MAYEQHTWTALELISKEKLNNMEAGIAAAVSIEAQTLTDEQKAQVRTNIGADAASVTPILGEDYKLTLG